MADADHKKFGAGMQGKGDGTGGMTNARSEDIPANAVLKNRDAKQHPEERGLDGRAVQTGRMEPHVDNQRPRDQPPLADERDRAERSIPPEDEP